MVPMEYVHTDIPAGMTISQWRSRRPKAGCGFCRRTHGALHALWCIHRRATTPTVR